MTGPDDRRIEQVERLLRAADPPPELPPSLAWPPAVAAESRRRSKRGFQLALGFAAALAVAAFAVGYLVGERGDRFETVATIAMHGVAPASSASAELDIGEPQADGNVPIEMRIRGLPPLPEGGWYDLELSREGRPVLSCGTFMTGPGTTTVRLSVGYALREWREEGRYDGWVVTAHLPGKPTASDKVLLTT